MQKKPTLQKASIQQLTELKRHYRPTKTLVVTGKNSFALSGAKTLINACFSPKEYIQFDNFAINPKFKDALNGTQLAIDSRIDCIIAIGGGSAIDIAKLIKGFIALSVENSHQPSLNTSITVDTKKAEELIRGKTTIPECSIPLITIPTTAGSGSEATHFAVVYINKQKFSVASTALLPSAHILDGSFLASASPYQKAVNGLDALAQAIESYWAVSSCKTSRDYSLKAIELLLIHLPKTIRENNIKDLDAVMLAAHLAGKAINITKTTAPHAFSYGFTSFHNVPHGHAVWLTLPKIFHLHCQANKDNINDKRGINYLQSIMIDLRKALNITETDNPEQNLQEFMTTLGVEPLMKNVGLTSKKQRLFIAEQVNTERLKNNPIKLNNQQIHTIFEL